uniref:Ig-like domain-containing protein n=1 Tax=Bos taurus TaxID=9913 RepID=A0AAA9S0W8_BOVIN
MAAGSSGLPCVEVPKHLERHPQNSGLLPASLPLAMACPPLALFLLGALLAASQPALTKPEALLVFPGQVAQLSCTISPHYAIVGDLGVSWYQQRAGSAPRLLLYYRSEEHQHRAPGIPDRFSAAADAAHNTCILTISPVQPEDDADYYCFIVVQSLSRVQLSDPMDCSTPGLLPSPSPGACSNSCPLSC